MNTPQLMHVRRIADTRGWFSETYSERRLAAIGIADRFVQDNHSFSAAAGTLRGLHFQVPPHAQAKLVRCIRGRVFDVAVDLRAGSPTYGSWVSAELAADADEQLYIPTGFAHGFLTLTPGSEIIYKVSDFYAPDCDTGIRWNDPAIGIEWPLPRGGPVLSEKDTRLPMLAEFESPFAYDGQPLVPLRGPP